MLPHHNSLVPVEVRHVEEDSIRHLLACEGLVSGECAPTDIIIITMIIMIIRIIIIITWTLDTGPPQCH